ncbi:hypothetical protein D9756_010751 [Leucocoprinus leucothites]|uniref:Transcription factor domain-containing protein n=1 Tax=Leucocoprinus leucothites TaxID=201217 RepID=A0A8H5FT31_9AGAR|nr:hypothetical protein D9756_010751 [Leucoagaricus leucothites]
MVSASELDDIYSPFRLQAMTHDEIPSSSEDGSGLHSPVGGVFPRMPQMPPLQGGSESFRYQHDPQVDISPTTEILAPQFDFAQGLNKNQQQQIPIFDTRLEPPSPSARQVTFPHYNQLHSSRYHLAHFPTQYPPVSSRIPATSLATTPVNFRFIPPRPEQPSSGGPSHEPIYYQQPPVSSSSASMGTDHRPNPVATAERTEPSMSNAPVVSVAHEKYDVIQLGPNATIVSEEITSASMMQCPNEGDQISVPRATDDPTPPNPKRRRTGPEPESDTQEAQPHRIKEKMVDSKRASPSSRHPDRPAELHIQTTTLHASPSLHRPSSGSDHFVKQEESPTYRRLPAYGYEHEPLARAQFPRPIDSNALPNEPHRMFSLPTSPIFEATQREWDQITELYGPQEIVDRINFLRLNTEHQLSFVNIDFLSAQIYDDVERFKIQPAFILAALALAQLIQSSVTNQGTAGMAQAVALRLQAQTAVDEARQSGLLNADLAKAQFLLAIFESSAYTEYSYSRATAALHALDDVITSLSLTTLDARDPSVSSFTHGSVPSVFPEDGPSLTGKICKCLPHEVNDASKDYQTRVYHLPWHHNWTREEIHEEEIRRLCWSALSLVSEHNAQCMALGRDVPNFSLNHPSNFVLLFPGEAFDRLRHKDPSDPLLPNESVWGLYCRSLLLWNFCVSVKEGHTTVDDKIEAFTHSVGVAQMIEDALNVHRCNLDTTIMYQTREYLFNIRMLVAHEVRVSVVGLTTSGRPGMLFSTKHVEEWVRAQQGTIQRVKSIIHHSSSGEDNDLTRQPFAVSWFVNQLNVAVLIWPYEQSMVGLLELAKDLLYIVDILNYYWECPENSTRTEGLRGELIKACLARGVAPPLTTSYVPQSIRTNTY